DATDEALLRALTARSRGGADVVMAATSGTVHSAAVFGWVTDRVLPDGRFRLAPAPLVEQLADLERQRADHPLVLVPQRRLRMMNSQLRDVAAVGARTETSGLSMNPADAAR